MILASSLLISVADTQEGIIDLSMEDHTEIRITEMNVTPEITNHLTGSTQMVMLGTPTGIPSGTYFSSKK